MDLMAIISLSEGMNDRQIVLIPKNDHPKQISHLRPISLWNISYKVILKTLTNRLKEIIDEYVIYSFYPHILGSFMCFYYFKKCSTTLFVRLCM